MRYKEREMPTAVTGNDWGWLAQKMLEFLYIFYLQLLYIYQFGGIQW